MNCKNCKYYRYTCGITLLIECAQNIPHVPTCHCTYADVSWERKLLAFDRVIKPKNIKCNYTPKEKDGAKDENTN